MPRYIEANDLVRAMTLQANRSALGEIAPPRLSYSEMLEIIADAPTADVAPRAEVARGIFEEIENIAYTHFDVRGDEQSLEILIDEFAELKNKYTEEHK